MAKKILITGAGGYIASVSTDLFLKNGYEVVAVDNFSRGYKQPLELLQKEYGEEKLRFYTADLRTEINDVLDKENGIQAVIHYAALCNVGESEKNPHIYFDNNVNASLSLLKSMKEHDINKIVVSSTCSLYGEPQTDTLDETHPVDPKSHPYGESKYMSERVIDWFHKVHGIQYIFMRYFNVCGATDDGKIGDSKKPSFHLMQNAVRGALGLDSFFLNNTQVDTPDGTPIRDYVNVADLNDAHLKAVEYIDTATKPEIFNLGTGTGNSVMEIIKAVEDITGVKLEMKEGERRKGDVSKAVASNKKITEMLGWQPKRSIQDSVNSLVTWYKTHPTGWDY
ncbi:MAG: UDP-glucose 4-epimerase GalE [Patescibacteria group bacterium]